MELFANLLEPVYEFSISLNLGIHKDLEIRPLEIIKSP